LLYPLSYRGARANSSIAGHGDRAADSSLPFVAARCPRRQFLKRNEEDHMLATLDHFVLATRDLDRCLDFYTGVLGMELEHYGEGRIALRFGPHKINVHPPGFEASIRARLPTPGSLDLCFLADVPLESVIKRLAECGLPIELGPVLRAGARGQIRSVYVRDPDENLIEIAEPA
jgi:catechol 2,3-dioxygenase-like lactoylglutathione lyase family enzyme